MAEKNVLGGDLAVRRRPGDGFFRDGTCRPPGPGQPHRVRGDDRRVPRPPARPGQRPDQPGAAVLFRPGARRPLVSSRRGGRWAGVAAPVVLAATSVAALEIVPLRYLMAASVDVPDDPSSLT